MARTTELAEKAARSAVRAFGPFTHRHMPGGEFTGSFAGNLGTLTQDTKFIRFYTYFEHAVLHYELANMNRGLADVATCLSQLSIAIRQVYNKLERIDRQVR